MSNVVLINALNTNACDAEDIPLGSSGRPQEMSSSVGLGEVITGSGSPSGALSSVVSEVTPLIVQPPPVHA